MGLPNCMRGNPLNHSQGANHGKLKLTQPVIKECNHIPQLLSIKGVSGYTGLSRSTIYELINEYSDCYDPTFPKKVQLTKVRVVWVASEIADWINAKIESRLA